jgi:hypothetical protein
MKRGKNPPNKAYKLFLNHQQKNNQSMGDYQQQNLNKSSLEMSSGKQLPPLKNLKTEKDALIRLIQSNKVSQTRHRGGGINQSAHFLMNQKQHYETHDDTQSKAQRDELLS